jgi:hypothetical protein
MRRVEVERHDPGRVGEQVVEDVAAARRDGHDPAVRFEIERFQIDDGIFPDLVIDEAGEPDREQPIEQGLLLAGCCPVDRLLDRRRLAARQCHHRPSSRLSRP